ncbi:MAG: hypothetical protein ACKVOY_15390 [Burkholderiaceae bacterium]
MIYYLRYVNVLKGLQKEDATADLEPVCALILDEIAVRELHDEPMTVSNLMELTNLASPATLHRKFSDMLKNEWVESRFENDNRRTKYIHLTKKSKNYYELKGKAMKKAFKLT